MTDATAARRIAAALPETEDRSGPDSLAFAVRGKQFAWTFQEKVDGRGPREPVLEVLAVRCTPEAKDMLLASDPAKFFTTDHYRGFPAVLVRLAAVDESELRELLVDGWRCQATKTMAKQYQAELDSEM